MSINVHVSGNPIKISRGKMVTADLDHSKKEFEKRRLIRLEQVRQQSKNIAEDVRNKVKREKVTQMKQIEEEGKLKLKNWQNRKLLELQTQYKKALKELGAGHREAEEIGDEEDFLEEQKLLNQELCVKRGHKATCKLNCQMIDDQRKKNALANRKKLVREIENTRAEILSSFTKANYRSEPRMKKKKHGGASDDLNILLPDSDSDLQGSCNSLSNITEYDEESSSCTCGAGDSADLNVQDNARNKINSDSSHFEEKPTVPLTMGTYVAPVNTRTDLGSSTQIVPPVSTQLPSSTSMHFAPPVSTQFTPSVSTLGPTHVKTSPRPTANKPYACHTLQEETSLDTRISDRIKRRGLAPQRQELRSPEPIQMPEVQSSSTAVRDFIHSRTCFTDCTCCCANRNLFQKDARIRSDYEDDNLPGRYKESEDVRINVPTTIHHSDSFQQRNQNLQDRRDSSILKEEDDENSDIKSRSQYLHDDRDHNNLKATRNKINNFHNRSQHLQDYRDHSNLIAAGIKSDNFQSRSRHLQKSRHSDILNAEDDKNDNIRRSQLSEGSKTNVVEIPAKPFIKLKSTSTDNKSNVSTKSPKRGFKPRTSMTKVISSKRSPTKVSSKVVAGSDNLDILPKQQPDTDNLDDLPKPSLSRQHPVQMYDHPNRFGYEKNIPSTSFVEKIPVESLEVIPDPDLEDDWRETQKRRHKDAQIRGRQALEKAKLQKECEDMMKRLPLLQKKERINEIYNDKPEYHMSDDRLREREQVKQNNLENAYNKIFPNLKPAVVTLPKTSQTDEERESSGADSVHTLNVANWDVDYKGPQAFSAQEVQDILKAFTQQDPHDRRAKLKELLKTLKLQKEELLRAISLLPKDESVDELINDLSSFNNDNEDKSKSKHKKKAPRKRSRKENEADVSIDSSTESSSTEPTKTGSKEVVGKSPRKKAKIKQKVIILQNTSTQTTPKPSTQDNAPHPPLQQKLAPVTCSKLHIPCDCDKENKGSSDNMCHIFIKLNDNNEPDVIVKSKEESARTVSGKSVDVGVQMSPELNKKPGRRRSASVGTKTDSVLEKSRTWKEQFSKNSVSTTSTSYLSPPDFQKYKTNEKPSDYFKQPQQKELPAAYSSHDKDHFREDFRHPRVLDCVKKLLSLTRVSVENLSVSTSNIETPSQSLIEMESNNPNQRLQAMVDGFKNRTENVVDGLNYSPDYSPVPFNSSASVSSSQLSQKETNSKSAVPEKDSSGSIKSKTRDRIPSQYADITDTCSKRIESLVAKILQLREEKIKMMQVPTNISKSPVNDKDGKDMSTTYMELPQYKSDSKESSKHSSTSLDEEEIYKRLMEIDHDFVGKMQQLHESDNKEKKEKTTFKSLTTTPVQSVSAIPQESEDSPSPNNTNEEILLRIHRLHNKQDPSPEDPPTKPQNQYVLDFLSDIPRLPKFEPYIDSNQQYHKRPPPSKGLTSIKKLNGNVTLVPHELSTIVEADSQMSTKVPSPETSRDSINFNQQLLMIPEIHEGISSPNLSVPDMSKKSPEASIRTKEDSKTVSTSLKDDSNKSLGEIPSITLDSSDKSRELKKSRESCDDSTCPAKDKKSLSSSSSDDIDKFENMLRSIGMDWAIPTLHKTQEALALTSSSSSLDLSRKKPHGAHTSVSGSEISLKDYLTQQIIKISSSTMLTDGSLGSFLGESSELSGIHKTTNSNQDKSRQRTSTPLGSSKFMSSSKSNEPFSDPELSSIKQESVKRKKDKDQKR